MGSSERVRKEVLPNLEVREGSEMLIEVFDIHAPQVATFSKDYSYN